MIHFDFENIRNEAARKLEYVKQVSTKCIEKLKTKIMLCNVCKDETKDMIIKT